MLRKSNPVHSAGTGWSIFGDEKNPIYFPLWVSQEETKMCNRDAPLLCQVGGWGGRASISHSSTGNQLNRTPEHFNSQDISSWMFSTALHSSCTDTAPSCTCPTPVLEFQGHTKALLVPGVQDKECLTLEAEKLLPWHLIPNRPTRRILRCYNSHIHHIE